MPVLVDGSQGAVHLDVDVRDLDVDFYVVTGHKLYGPTGIGVLYGKRALLEALPPFNGGGEMIEDVTRDVVTYNAPPHRFEAGTPPIVQAIGLGAALDYIEGVGRARMRAHEDALSAYAHERLGAINSLRIIGTRAGQGADPVLHHGGRARARRRDDHRSLRRRGARGHPLRDAAVAAFRRDLDLPRLVRALQYPRRGRRARRRAHARAKTVRLRRTLGMTDSPTVRDVAEPSPGQAAVGDVEGRTRRAHRADRRRR